MTPNTNLPDGLPDEKQVSQQAMIYAGAIRQDDLCQANQDGFRSGARWVIKLARTLIDAKDAEIAELRERCFVLQSQVDNSDVNLDQNKICLNAALKARDQANARIKELEEELKKERHELSWFKKESEFQCQQKHEAIAERDSLRAELERALFHISNLEQDVSKACQKITCLTLDNETARELSNDSGRTQSQVVANESDDTKSSASPAVTTSEQPTQGNEVKSCPVQSSGVPCVENTTHSANALVSNPPSASPIPAEAVSALGQILELPIHLHHNQRLSIQKFIAKACVDYHARMSRKTPPVEWKQGGDR